MSDEIDLSYAVASYRINSPLNIVDAVGKHFVRRPCSDVLRFLAYMPLDGRYLFKAASIERQDCCFLPMSSSTRWRMLNTDPVSPCSMTKTRFGFFGPNHKPLSTTFFGVSISI